MYLLKPNSDHRESVADFVSKCQVAGDNDSDIFGGYQLARTYVFSGYNAWLDRLNLNAMARQWRSKSGIEPGHTFLIAEAVDNAASVDPDYVAKFPVLPNGDWLVGLVTIKAGLKDSDSPSWVPSNPFDDGSRGVLSLCTLPAYRATANYVLLLADIMAYVVCEGLPYKFLLCEVPDTEERQEYRVALEKCDFYQQGGDLISGVRYRYYHADLRAAHRLKSRIQEWSREEG